jgi:hypothetical protein
VRQANAACDQDWGALNQSLFNGVAPSSTDQQGSSSQSSQINKINALIGDVSSLSKLVGDLGALQTPEDSHAPEVEAVISSGHTLVSNLQTFTYAEQNAVDNMPGTTISQDVATALSSFKKFLTSVVTWRKTIGTLGLTRCPFWTAGNPYVLPTLPQPTASPTPQQSPTSSLTDSEQQLVNNLNSDDLTNCNSRSDLEGDGIVAAVNCETVDSGPTKQPLVVQFSDISSAQAWFNNKTIGFDDQNDCASGHRLGTWTWNNVDAGLLGCSYTSDGNFQMVWVIDDSLIGVIAEGSDGSTMYAWWRNAAYVVSCGC